MRIGDVSVRLIPVEGGVMREKEDGTVIATSGQVYKVEIENHADRRAIARVKIDGENVTEGGLVLYARQRLQLERCVTEGETGRFTVFEEGRTDVFGPDGGRGNENLGLVQVEYQREKPPMRPARPEGVLLRGSVTRGRISKSLDAGGDDFALREMGVERSISFSDSRSEVESAAGTGLTGHSEQRFQAVSNFPLEDEITRVSLRLVIGTPEAIKQARPLPHVAQGNPVPVRPRG